MAAVDIDNLTLKQISDLEARIEKAKSQAVDKAKTDLKAKINRLLDGSGFTVAELYGFTTKRGRNGSKSAPKYANPDDPTQTWTGRGRKPNWLVARLKKGAKIENFAI